MKEALPTAYNRAYMASCLRHYAQIPLRETSDTLGLRIRPKRYTPS